MREVGFKERSAAGWNWLFAENPALEANPDAPIGWILDCGGEVVGYLGNIPMAYVRGAETYRGATCCALYVREPFRAQSVKLMSAFFRQRGVDLFLSTTANDASLPLYQLFKAVTPPDASFLTDFAWVGDVDELLRHEAEKYVGWSAVAALLARASAPFVRLGLRIANRDLRRYARNASVDVEPVRLQDVDGRFDALWQAVRTSGHLMAQRCSRTLRWYMSDPDRGSDVHLLAAMGPHGIEGYALCARHHAHVSDFSRFNVFDILLHPEAPDGTLEVLLVRAADLAAKEHAALMILTGYSAHVASKLPKLRPFERPRPISSVHVKPVNPALAGAAIVPGFWFATPLDGDRSLVICDASRRDQAAAGFAAPAN